MTEYLHWLHITLVCTLQTLLAAANDDDEDTNNNNKSDSLDDV